MKLCLFTLLTAAAAALSAQSSTTTFSPDINGNPVAQTAEASVPGDHTLYTRGPDGTAVPREKSESRVLSDGPNGKVVETTIQHFGFDGQPTTLERVVTEEQKRAGGSTIQETHSWSDVNGTLHEGERRVIDSRTQGNTTSTTVEVLRTSLSGDFVPAEKHQVVKTVTGNKTNEDETIYKPAGNGELRETGRNIKTEQTVDGKTITNETIYQADLQGNLRPEGGQVKTVTKAADGSEVVQVDILGSARGSATSADSALVVAEQKTIVRRTSPDGSVVETTSVREAAQDAPNTFVNDRVVSETVCQGQCGAAPAANSAAKPDPPSTK